MKVKVANRMTLEELIDYVLTNLITQKKRCMVNSLCIYGTADGSHCGVGWILDETDDVLMGFKGGVHALLKRYTGTLPDTLDTHTDLWCNMQSIHDSDNKAERAFHLAGARTHHPELFRDPRWDDYVESGEYSKGVPE